MMRVLIIFRIEWSMTFDITVFMCMLTMLNITRLTAKVMVIIETSTNNQGWGQIHFIKYKIQIHFFQSLSFKYKYNNKNLIKYKYAVFVSVFANTNTYLTPAMLIIHVVGWVIYKTSVFNLVLKMVDILQTTKAVKVQKFLRCLQL